MCRRRLFQDISSFISFSSFMQILLIMSQCYFYCKYDSLYYYIINCSLYILLGSVFFILRSFYLFDIFASEGLLLEEQLISYFVLKIHEILYVSIYDNFNKKNMLHFLGKLLNFMHFHFHHKEELKCKILYIS